MPEHCHIVIRFLFQCKRVGTRCRWHAPETVLALGNVQSAHAAHWWGGATECFYNGVGGFLPGGDNGCTLRQLFKQSGNVGRGGYFEEFVRGIFLQSHDLARGVVERYSSPGAELHDSLLVEALFALQLKMMPVAKEQQTHHAPHVVYPVRIEEGHRPLCLWRRKTAKHQDFCILRQERLEGVSFGDGHAFKEILDITADRCPLSG